jgi:hypothetical protein
MAKRTPKTTAGESRRAAVVAALELLLADCSRDDLMSMYIETSDSEELFLSGSESLPLLTANGTHLRAAIEACLRKQLGALPAKET